MFFKDHYKKATRQLEEFLSSFPHDYDMNNIKISTSGPGDVLRIVVLYKWL
ncbi:MAG: hypothetical protein JW891_11670 [Candidatus Lokiarchaeota archaeon]|nr:hypothetical protein [Candidatus Lokiarchaeota archaeon]